MAENEKLRNASTRLEGLIKKIQIGEEIAELESELQVTKDEIDAVLAE